MRLKFVICAAALGLVANAVTMAQKPVKFTSVYSSLNKGCKTLRGGPGTDDASLCRGPAGYEVEVYFSAATMQINAEKRGSDKSAGLATLDLTFDDRRTTLEWRLANGKPFASFDGTPLEMTLTPGGGVKSVDLKTKNSVTGKWRVKGEAYCSQWPGRPERCFTVDKVGSQYEFTEDGKPAGYWER